MIYVTGDCHARFDRFSKCSFPEQKNLTKDDYVIVCGDFGVWDFSLQQKYELDELNSRSFTTLFIDGNHENYDILDNMEEVDWHGGKVHFIRPNIIHLIRGYIYDIDGYKFFCMGGAASHDISDGILDPHDSSFIDKLNLLRRNNRNMYRVNHLSWWEREMPSDKEYERAIHSLTTIHFKVDYVLSHCAPTSVLGKLSDHVYESDKLTDFLQCVCTQTKFKHWFFGHYHKYAEINNFTCIYNKIIPLDNYK